MQGFIIGFNFGLSAVLEFKFIDKYYMDNEEVNEYEGYNLMNLKFRYQWKGLMAYI